MLKCLSASILLMAGLALAGFAVGGVVSAQWIGSARTGFEGSTTVAVCAIGGALTGFVVAVVLAFRLTLPHLICWAVFALTAGIACLGFLLNK